jgi:hypothetical protein
MTHPTDLELAAWADEPENAAAEVHAHLAGCARCGQRLGELAETRAALALDPPMPSAAAFSAQRERILAAIGAAPPAERGRIVRRLGWLAPLAAAATIAAILLVARTDGPDEPRSADVGADTVAATGATPPSERLPLPVVADARDAAEDAASVIVPADPLTSEDAIVPSEPFDEDVLEAALAAADPLAPPLSVERSASIESEFAQLPEEEQSAVLSELASADFDL